MIIDGDLEYNSELTQVMQDITNILASKTVEERLAWFKQSTYETPIEFVREIGGTVYLVRSRFNPDARENIPEKVKRILSKPSPESIEEERQI